MKTIVITFWLVFSFATSYAQLPERTKEETGFLGLFDVHLAYGQQRQEVHQDPSYISPYSTVSKKASSYAYLHFQESMLSNYFFATKEDKRVKFGIQETFQLGYISSETKVASTLAGYEPQYFTTDKKKIIFNYEVGIAVAVRLNNKIDAGVTYYPFIVTIFSDYQRYAKFRFRYNHVQAELSAFGKKALDIRYVHRVKNSLTIMNYFFGISYMPYASDNSSLAEYDKNKFMLLNLGFML